MMDRAREQVRTGNWSENWVPMLRKTHIPDFSGWDKDHAKYQQEPTNLFRGPQQSA